MASLVHLWQKPGLAENSGYFCFFTGTQNGLTNCAAFPGFA
jgi:hypothetical protein